MQLPDSIFFSFLALMLVVVVTLLVGLHKLLQRAGYDQTQHRKTLLLASGGIFVWLLFLTVLAEAGVFSNFTAMPPRLPIALFPPLIVGFLLLRSPKVKALLAHLPPSWVIYPQVFRVPLEVILWGMFVTGIGPLQMTYEGYNFDVVSGLTAPLVAYLVFHKKVLPKSIAIAWNIMGITLVAIIVSIALLSFPFPHFQYFTEEPANRAIAYWPMIWLPGFLVPLAVWWHIVSLKQLIGKNA